MVAPWNRREGWVDKTLRVWKRVSILRLFRIGTGVQSISNQQRGQALFQFRFLRRYGLLHFIACCVLGRAERTEDVIERCRLKASGTPARFEYEGAFRSWLLRVLIDEAVVVLRRSQEEEQGYDTLGQRGDPIPQSPAR